VINAIGNKIVRENTTIGRRYWDGHRCYR
jgi:hypothetical protein